MSEPKVHLSDELIKRLRDQVNELDMDPRARVGFMALFDEILEHRAGEVKPGRICESRGHHVFSATHPDHGCKDCGIPRDHDDHRDAAESTTLQLATRGWEIAIRLAEVGMNNAKAESLRYQGEVLQLEDENDALRQEVARLRAFIARIPTTSYPEQRCNNCGAVGSVPWDKCGACGKALL